MSWQVLDELARRHGLQVGAPTVGQTVGGTHVNGSWHYLGLARDYGRTSDPVGISKLFAPLARSRPDLIPELFGYDGVGFDNGKPYQAAGHTGDHTHVAVRAGVTVDQLESALAGSSVAPAPSGGSTAVSGGASGVGSLAFIGKTSTAIRLTEILVGSVLILMGLVALSNALQKGIGQWATQ